MRKDIVYDAFKLDDKVAIVTGSGEGVGFEIARALRDSSTRAVLAEPDPDLRSDGHTTLFRSTHSNSTTRLPSSPARARVSASKWPGRSGSPALASCSRNSIPTLLRPRGRSLGSTTSLSM